MKHSVLTLIFLFFSSIALCQTGTIEGYTTDESNGDTLINAVVILQGTDLGAVTDMEGHYSIYNVPAGTYNIVTNYVSYEQQINQVQLAKGQLLTLNIKLAPESGEDVVEITARARTDNDRSLIEKIRTSDVMVTGYSGQQIQKSLDRDASEVIRRVPGVTIRDGRFVIVRGLIERYNSVWLNNAATPSSEADVRAFSFDVIPSNAIDHILIYKAPSPEFPADFAGASVQIFTKSNADRDRLSLGYSLGYNTQTTFSSDFQTYQGGKTDWLGFDDGTRALPSSFPNTSLDFSTLKNNPSDDDKEKINTIGRSFNKIWEPYHMRPIPNQSFSASLEKRFVLKKASIGNLTTFNYSNNYNFFEAYKAQYDGYDVSSDRPYYRHEFQDARSINTVRLGGLMNWMLIYGNNQKLEFRNIVNQQGTSRVTARSGYDLSSANYFKQTELYYQSRFTYLGQITGRQNFNEKRTLLDWTLGYSYANRNQPDTRRSSKAVSMDADTAETPYAYQITGSPDPRLFGRLYLYNNENIYNFNANFDHSLKSPSRIATVFKAGVYLEQRDRDFRARNIGFVRAGIPSFQIFTQPIDSLFRDENINFSRGIKVDEKTDATDSYKAQNKLAAGYSAVKFTYDSVFTVYGGVRVEDNLQQLKAFDGDSITYDNHKLDFFPSVTLSYNLNKRSALRGSYARSVNRPEFREVSPFVYYDFEQVASIYGNPELRNAYINNYDLRYEFYPTSGELITIGAFYKHFSNTIEAHLLQIGSDLNYRFLNTQTAKNLGAEIDVRKSLMAWGDRPGLLRNFKDFTLVFNAAVINSRVNTDDPNERDSVRVMQGQSPFIVNTGIFYQNDSAKLTISLLYNVLGKRIIFVGDESIPHTWELPRNSLDLTIIKGIGKHAQIKAGIKDLLNGRQRWVQYYDFDKDMNGDGVMEKEVRQLDFYAFRPGATINFGFNWIF